MKLMNRIIKVDEKEFERIAAHEDLVDEMIKNLAKRIETALFEMLEEISDDVHFIVIMRSADATLSQEIILSAPVDDKYYFKRENILYYHDSNETLEIYNLKTKTRLAGEEIKWD